MVMSGRSTKEKTWREQYYRQREEHRRHLKDTAGHGKSKHKTQQDKVQ